MLAPPRCGIGFDQTGLAEHHFGQQAVEKIGPARAAPPAFPARLETVGHSGKDAVERCALLYPAGEIEPPQGTGRLIAREERAIDEPREAAAQRPLLRRKAQDQAAPRLVHFFEQALGLPRLLVRHDLVESGDKIVHHRARLLDRESRAKHRAAAFDVKIVVEFAEAGDEVGLGHKQINRGRDFERRADFRQAAANDCGMAIEPGAVGSEQFVHADRHQQAVDRGKRAVPLQQREETFPPLTVGGRVGILGGVAPGRIDHHRLVGEPEVQIAGAADPLQRLVGQRKA